MGLLDDAIRDHLDLKRRRGGDPSEIERAEHEALGPVRRDRLGGPDDFDGLSVPDDGLPAYDREEDPYDEEGYEEYGVEEEWEEEYEQPSLAPGEASGARHGDLADSPVMDTEVFEEPLGAEDPARPPSYPTDVGAGDETMQYDVEEALASEPSQAKRAPEWVEQSDEWVEQSEERAEPFPSAEQPALHDEPEAPREPGAERSVKPEEDVVEETPEFFQDPPDHERLWFDQRPPRDFDFDG